MDRVEFTGVPPCLLRPRDTIALAPPGSAEGFAMLARGPEGIQPLPPCFEREKPGLLSDDSQALLESAGFSRPLSDRWVIGVPGRSRNFDPEELGTRRFRSAMCSPGNGRAAGAGLVLARGLSPFLLGKGGLSPSGDPVPPPTAESLLHFSIRDREVA
jgi:hypothetical protein